MYVHARVHVCVWGGLGGKGNAKGLETYQSYSHNAMGRSSSDYEKQFKNISNAHNALISSDGLCHQQKNTDLPTKHNNLVKLHFLLPLKPKPKPRPRPDGA